MGVRLSERVRGGLRVGVEAFRVLARKLGGEALHLIPLDSAAGYYTRPLYIIAARHECRAAIIYLLCRKLQSFAIYHEKGVHDDVKV